MPDEQRFQTVFRIGDGGQELEIPYNAKRGGIFLTIRDAEGELLGDVQITAANVFWKRPHAQLWKRLAMSEFCDLLEKHGAVTRPDGATRD
jgi:hypothetical protein